MQTCLAYTTLHASCSFLKDMNRQCSFTRAGHRATKCKTRTEVSAMPTICLEGVCVIVQILVYSLAGLYISVVQLRIPPIFVQVVIKRNRPHYSKCFVDAWNVVGQDSNSSRCYWSISLTRSVQDGFSCRKTKICLREKRARVSVLTSRPLKENTTPRKIFIHSLSKSHLRLIFMFVFVLVLRTHAHFIDALILMFEISYYYYFKKTTQRLSFENMSGILKGLYNFVTLYQVLNKEC